MDTFECHGWLHITIGDASDVALIKYNHEEDHILYCNVEVPPDIQAYIGENKNMTPTQVDVLTGTKIFKLLNLLITVVG
jgi:hypothetical protein